MSSDVGTGLNTMDGLGMMVLEQNGNGEETVGDVWWRNWGT